MFDEGLIGQPITRSLSLRPSDTYETITPSSDEAQTPPILVGGASFGAIEVWTNPSGTTTSITAYGSSNGQGADCGPITDANGSAVVITIGAAPSWYELPSACLSVPFLHLKTNAGTATIRVFTKG